MLAAKHCGNKVGLPLALNTVCCWMMRLLHKQTWIPIPSPKNILYCFAHSASATVLNAVRSMCSEVVECDIICDRAGWPNPPSQNYFIFALAVHILIAATGITNTDMQRCSTKTIKHV